MTKGLVHEPLFVKAAGALLAQAPAFAGAVVSLAFVGQLSVKGRVMAVVVGALTAMFIAPAVADTLSHFCPWLPPTFNRAVQFLTAMSSMAIIPPFLAFVKGVAADPVGYFLRMWPRPAPPPDNRSADKEPDA